MLFVDVLNAALSLDVAYFTWLVLANIHWIFTFAVVMVFFQARKKHQVFYVIMLILMLYAVVDFSHVLGWDIPPIMQIPVFLASVIIVAFENYKPVEKWKGILTVGSFWVIWLAFAFLG